MGEPQGFKESKDQGSWNTEMIGAGSVSMMGWRKSASCGDNIEGAGSAKCVSCAKDAAHTGKDTLVTLTRVRRSNGESCRGRHKRSLAHKKTCGVEGIKTDKLSSISADVAKIDWIRWNYEGPSKGEDTVLEGPKRRYAPPIISKVFFFSPNKISQPRTPFRPILQISSLQLYFLARKLLEM